MSTSRTSEPDEGAGSLHLSDFDYHLPPELIAQTPVEPRDSSRLLVIHRDTGRLEHRIFRDIGDYLRPGDLLVANDSRVLPGRLWARKDTGGPVEVLLLRPAEGGWWEGLVRPSQRLHAGQLLHLVASPDAQADDAAPQSTERIPGAADAAPLRTPHTPHTPRSGGRAESASEPDALAADALGKTMEVGAVADDAPAYTMEMGERTPAGGRLVRFSAPVEQVVARYGHVPLPPYIHAPLRDPERYQTVYARVTGSAAAPTAGLHFTPSLLDSLAAQGVRFAFVTLHVGPDTFRPVRVERVVEHEMHAEFVVVPDATAQAIAETRQAGGRVIAVGTTAVRSLESWAAQQAQARQQEQDMQAAQGAPRGQTEQQAQAQDTQPAQGRLDENTGWSGWTRLFIYPGYRFRVVDAMITNFHLPKSTLLMLVSAFAGRDLIARAYDEAVANGYRFFSFGDATLML